MDEEQVARCATELTHFKQLWEDAAYQACYEKHRAGNCEDYYVNDCGTYYCERMGDLAHPCAGRFEDCPLHKEEK